MPDWVLTCVDDERMLAPLSEMAIVTSLSRPRRSDASMTISTWNSVAPEVSHSTSIMRPGSLMRPLTLGQVERCTETPLPRVTKPTMSSPATGLQQRARWTRRSGSPLAMTPQLLRRLRLFLLAWRWRSSMARRRASSSAARWAATRSGSSSMRIASTLLATWRTVTLPFARAANMSSAEW